MNARGSYRIYAWGEGTLFWDSELSVCETDVVQTTPSMGVWEHAPQENLTKNVVALRLNLVGFVSKLTTQHLCSKL